MQAPNLNSLQSVWLSLQWRFYHTRLNQAVSSWSMPAPCSSFWFLKQLKRSNSSLKLYGGTLVKPVVP